MYTDTQFKFPIRRNKKKLTLTYYHISKRTNRPNNRI